MSASNLILYLIFELQKTHVHIDIAVEVGIMFISTEFWIWTLNKILGIWQACFNLWVESCVGLSQMCFITHLTFATLESDYLPTDCAHIHCLVLCKFSVSINKCQWVQFFHMEEFSDCHCATVCKKERNRISAERFGYQQMRHFFWSLYSFGSCLNG